MLNVSNIDLLGYISSFDGNTIYKTYYLCKNIFYIFVSKEKHIPRPHFLGPISTILTMYCKRSFLEINKTQNEDGLYDIDLMEKDDKNKKTCLEKQFEGVDEKLQHLSVAYDKENDEMLLMANHMQTTQQ